MYWHLWSLLKGIYAELLKAMWRDQSVCKLVPLPICSGAAQGAECGVPESVTYDRPWPKKGHPVAPGVSCSGKRRFHHSHLPSFADTYIDTYMYIFIYLYMYKYIKVDVDIDIDMSDGRAAQSSMLTLILFDMPSPACCPKRQV